MKISDIIATRKTGFSFEFFPPKNDKGFDDLYKAVERLKQLDPLFVSVTYGAGGGTRKKTIDITAKIKHEIGIESMAHMTCVGADREEIDRVLSEIRDKGIENILALRGDPPKGEKVFTRREGGFGYANELVAFIHQRYDFCIGVAGYPEGHPECPDLKVDMDNLKRKVDEGGEFIITQLFFDNNVFFDFVDRAVKAGIKVPIIPGIMPVLTLGQVQRIADMCGASIPHNLMKRLAALQDSDEATESYGITHATGQCEELIENGVPLIHLYTLNRSHATWEILKNLGKT